MAPYLFMFLFLLDEILYTRTTIRLLNEVDITMIADCFFLSTTKIDEKQHGNKREYLLYPFVKRKSKHINGADFLQSRFVN